MVTRNRKPWLILSPEERAARASRHGACFENATRGESEDAGGLLPRAEWMKVCGACGVSVRYDLVEHAYFGFGTCEYGPGKNAAIPAGGADVP